MLMDNFTVLAEPIRRQILDELRVSEHTVNELVEALDMHQPGISKHLRILRDAGFVSCRKAAQKRIYRVESRPFKNLDAWLAPYRRLWNKHLDALEHHLDKKEKS